MLILYQDHKDNICIRVIAHRRSTDIQIEEGSTVEKMVFQIANRCKISPYQIKVVVGNHCIDMFNDGTIEDYGIEHSSVVHVVQRTHGGGGIEGIYSNCKQCQKKFQCPFHELFRKWDILEIAEIQENAYLTLCQFEKFRLPNDVIWDIRDNNESSYVRLGDALHHIYHKDSNITLEDIMEIISKDNN